MTPLSDKTKRELSLILFYASFYFLWVTVSAPASFAGTGWLTDGQQERVYYVQQGFLLCGFLLYAALSGASDRPRFGRVCSLAGFFVFFICTAGLLFADNGTPFYVGISLAAMLCLGGLCGAVYHRMSREMALGAAAARCMGFGSAVAILAQYLLQLRWGQSPLLPLFMAAAFLLLVCRLLSPDRRASAQEKPVPKQYGAFHLLLTCLITALLLLFGCFYNETIHRLTVQPEFTGSGAYTWPRLLLIPCYLIFAAVGDRQRGRLVPITALCITLTGTMNAVLTGSRGTSYWLNLCLFYCSVTGAVCYYTLQFWRLAPETAHPALWASMGRVIDCAMVPLTAGVRLGSLPAAAVLGLDVAALVLIILMMALGGDFNLKEASAAQVPAEKIPSLLGPEETLKRMRGRYDLTGRETEVLRQLVLTEDKQAVISEQLNIQVKTLQDYVTRLYRKTGATTRSGLTALYHENRRQP